ncbi:MAG: TonB-dependent receptor [Lewinellaceae bacterium]|nr:TonB-dependent receptor [Phaeodactylibacter sp.]MCB9042066.1 TonB-dependent receptor [Lewinellaceae bacterium]
MKNRLILQLSTLLLLLQAPFLIQAQPDPDKPAKGLVKGLVVDGDTGQPLDYATITLFSSEDSSLVTGGVTDAAGAFRLELKFGSYYANVAFIAFKDVNIGGIEVNRDNPVADLGTIEIFPSATVLAEVEVRAEKSNMQISLDKRVFNVGKDLANIGGTASDVLDNVPSVTVDAEGGVSLRGSSGVRILINGRPSGLVGVGDTDGLRQIPANLIDRIEVITNPSARYEAEGMAGIINIILKKDRRQGLNGSLDLTTGYPHNYGLAANANYRTGNLNLFGNYGVSYRKRPGKGSLYQEIYDRNEFGPDTTFILQQNQERERGGWDNTLRAGAEYFFNDKTSLTASFTYEKEDGDNSSDIEYRDYLFNLNRLTGITRRLDLEKEIENNLEYVMSFRKEFEREGHLLTADVRYQDNDEVEKSTITEEYFTPEYTQSGIPGLNQRSRNEEKERLILGQMDYIQPFAKEGKFEAGLRASLREINTDYQVEELKGSDWELLPNFTNEFLYDENIYAAYGIVGNKFGRFSVQVGVRAELTDVNTQLLDTGEENPRDYLNLFPSGHLGYEFAGQNSFMVSYSRRINRPRFWDLNPFFSFSDARNIRSGNPNLNPEFTNSFEVGHLKYWDKMSLSSSVYYRYTEGIIERIRTLQEDGTTLTRPENLATEDAYGLDVTFSASPADWWDLDGNVNFFRSIINGNNIDTSFTADALTWNGRITSKMDLWKFVDAQVRFNYRAPRITTQGRNKALYHIDLAFSKDILDSKGTLTLSVSDLLNSRRWRYIFEGDDFYSRGDFQWRARQVTLTFNYRLNQKKQRQGGGRGDFGGGEGEF